LCQRDEGGQKTEAAELQWRELMTAATVSTLYLFFSTIHNFQLLQILCWVNHTTFPHVFISLEFSSYVVERPVCILCKTIR